MPEPSTVAVSVHRAVDVPHATSPAGTGTEAQFLTVHPRPTVRRGPLANEGARVTCPPDVYSPANAPVIEVAAARRAGNTAASNPATTDSATNTAI